MDRYDAIVIGLGNIGARFRNTETPHPFNHSEALRQHERIRLVGGADPSPENRSCFEDRFGLPAHPEPGELLGRRPRFASVCSPSALHYDHAMQCLEAGVKMIWLEKPPAETPEQLGRIQAEGRARGATVLVNYQRRYCPNYCAVRDLVSGAKLGLPLAGHVAYTRGLELNGCHMLDALFFLTGDRGGIRLDAASATAGDDNPCFSFTTDGLPVSVTGMDLPYHCVEVTVYLERGRVALVHSGFTSRVDVVVENEYAPGYYRLADAGDTFSLPSSDRRLMFPSEAIDDLMDAHEHGRGPLSSLDTAAQTQELMHLVRARLS